MSLMETLEREVAFHISPAVIPQGEAISDLMKDVLDSFLPPPDISAAAFSEDNVLFDTPKSGLRNFSLLETPYQRRILEVLSSNEYEGATFVAPSRAGKSAMGLPVMVYAAMIDPRDMMIIAPTRTAAGIYAKGDFAKFIAANPDFKDMILKGKSTDALLLKVLQNGMIISIVWPTATNLAGVDRGVIVIMDYDRIKGDVSGEGSVWTQAYARTKLYGKRRKIFAESSPSRLPERVKPFEKTSEHLAPDYPGIFSLYNDGTRECWYWKCLDGCGEYFQAHPDYLHIPEEGTIHERAAGAHVMCPHCKQQYHHDGAEGGGASKYDLNKSGVWVPDGMTLDKDGVMHGTILSPSRIPSFWLTGMAAAWQNWNRMAEALLSAREKFEKTGDDGELKNVTNTEFGMPYFPPGIESDVSADDLMARAQARPFSRRIVPAAARYLITTVDMQKWGWDLQTHAFDLEGRMWVIHRTAIKRSKREIINMSTGEVTFELAKPFTHSEDWDCLADYLKDLKYAVEGKPGTFLRPAMIAIDSGGGHGKDDEGKSASATNNAYKFWRKLRKEGSGIHNRIRLLKGEPLNSAPVIEEKYQGLDGNKDVPVFMIGSTKAKDITDALLRREEEGPGFVYLPSFENKGWFLQLMSERKVGERWEKMRPRNETWDLIVYAQAIIRLPRFKGDQLHLMSEVPDFALDIDSNPHAVRMAQDGKEVKQVRDEVDDMDLEDLAALLNG